MKIYTKNSKGLYEEYVHVWTDFLPNQQWFVETRSCVQDLNHSGEVHEMVEIVDSNPQEKVVSWPD